MSRKKWEVERRTFLRASGAAIALPVLNAMLPSIARAQVGQKNSKLLFIWHPNGLPMASKANGFPYSDWTEFGSPDINPKLEAKLAAVRDYTTILCGLQNAYSTPSSRKMRDDFNGKSHAHGAAMISAHCGKAVSQDSDMAKTFDQYIAEANRGSRFESLAINLNPRGGQTPLSENLINTVSWKGPNNPVQHHSDPRALFDLIFPGGVNTPSQPGLDPMSRRELLGKRGILDNLVNEIKSIQNKVGKEDRFTLDKYFTEVEELDRRTASVLNGETPPPAAANCTVGARPGVHREKGLNEVTFKAKREAFEDIVIKALQCDLTRVSSMMLGNNAGFGQTFNLPGMKQGPKVGGGFGALYAWHPYQHWYSGSQGYMADKKIAHENFVVINEFLYEGLANLALKMKATPVNGGQNLLDETLIVYGSTLGAERGSHDPTNWSRILIGKGDGVFKTDQKIKYKLSPYYATGENESISSLWLTLMKGFGVDINTFGDTSKVLNELYV